MKYDFKDLAFIIHFRVDVPERLRNLQIVLDYYYDKCKNLEFIIVNDDAQPEKILKEIHKKYENIKILFYKNKSYHNKSLSFNSAFKFVGGTAPTLSTAANAVDRIDYVIKSSNVIHCAVSLDVK